MFKGTAEIYWGAQNAQDVDGATHGFLYGWLKRTKPVLYYLVTLPPFSENARQVQGVRNEAENKSNASLLTAFIIRKQHKDQAVERTIKDRFFYYQNTKYRDLLEQKITGWNNISTKTWKRHSALLVYGKQLHDRRTARELNTSLLMNSTTNEIASADNRIMFRVKSIRRLPVWSTSLSEMELIENDFNTSRVIDIEKFSNDLAKAA